MPQQSEHKPRIFLCHASEDKLRVQELCHTLKDAGYHPWLDKEELLPGQDWWTEIKKVISDPFNLVIVCLSGNSVTKRGVVQKEIKRALDVLDQMPEDTIYLIPARLEDCAVPEGLSRRHYVDLFEPNGFEKLTQALDFEIGTRKTPPQPTSAPASTTPEATPAPTQPAQRRLSRGLLVGIGVLVLVVIITVLAFLVGQSGVGGEIDTEAILKALVATATEPAKAGITQTEIDLEAAVATAVAATEQARASVEQPLEVTADTPTAEPSPSNTPVPPTNTPTPTNTPVPPTNTPTPTNTLVPPTDTPTPFPQTITATEGSPMVLIPAGPFTMGSDSGDADEQPVREVTLDAFYIDQYEVTNARYAACMAAGACELPSCGRYEDLNKVNHPVVCVNWEQANTYCKWRKGGLPTEAEWEKAARGTDGWIYPWGNTFDGNRLNFCDRNCVQFWADKNYDDGYAETAPVGSYANGVSPYGVYDMAGNMLEWVADWYDKDYYATAPSHNPQGPDDGEEKVLRGGAFSFAGVDSRASRRFSLILDPRHVFYGFRCVAAAPE